MPGAVATGGTVCSMYAGHRISRDIDFVVADLKTRFDQVRDSLESDAGWALARVRSPVLILGSLDQIPIAFRQLRRAQPIETVNVSTEDGVLPIPTLEEECLRIKAFLASDRNLTRGFYDFVELALLLPRASVVEALAGLDMKWSTENRPGVALEVMKTLAECQPLDDAETVFPQMHFLRPRVTKWDDAQRICREISGDLAIRLLEN